MFISHVFKTVLQAPHIPSLKSLSVHGTPALPLANLSCHISKSLMNHPVAFPCLTELCLVPYYKEHLNEYHLGKVIQDLLVLRAITRLAIPRLQDNNVMESLKNHVSYLEVHNPLCHDCVPLILRRTIQPIPPGMLRIR